MTTQSYDAFIAPVNVAYIGNKPQKRDTVANTGVVWFGFGDVQTVDARAASLLLKHPKVWQHENYLATIQDQLTKSLNEPDKPSTADSSQDDGADAGQANKSEDDQANAGSQDDGEKEQDNDPENEDKEDGEDEAPNAKIEAIKVAICALDQANTDHFTKSGQPKVAAVNMLLSDGLVADAKEIAQAFKELGGE